jgi:enoyl-CoA hydratase
MTTTVDRDGHVTWITLNRPDALNTLTHGSLDEIGAVLDAAEKGDGTRVIVITGAGRAFCAGADLTSVGDDSIPFLERIQELLLRVQTLPLPVIAAVNGVTMGGGLELACSADIVLAASGARIGDGHANVGVIPGAGSASVLPRLIGPGLAKYLLFTGDTLRAEDLHRAGLVAQVFPAEGFRDAVAAVAARIAAKSPLGLSTVKRLVAQGLEQPTVAAAMRLELDANVTYTRSYDMAEGVRAFREKREPRFLGR